MKLMSMLPALAGLVVLTGCETPTPSLLSLESVASDSDLTSVEGLAGAWENGDQTHVYLVDSSAVQILKDLLANPPYPPTATPTPLPTLTPTRTPTITPTPGPGTPSVTPPPAPSEVPSAAP